MNVPLFTLLNTRLNPLNVFVLRNVGAVFGSEATNPAVTATTLMVGHQCFPFQSFAGNKKIAFTGAKKLSYKDSQRNTSAAYNYSTVAAVQQLTSLFQSVAATLEFGRRLVYFHRYQKLALDDELKRMEDQARHGELIELQALKPVLQDIYDDTSVMNVVRARAHRILEIDPVSVVGK